MTELCSTPPLHTVHATCRDVGMLTFTNLLCDREGLLAIITSLVHIVLINGISQLKRAAHLLEHQLVPKGLSRALVTTPNWCGQVVIH